MDKVKVPELRLNGRSYRRGDAIDVPQPLRSEWAAKGYVEKAEDKKPTRKKATKPPANRRCAAEE
jgi:hypothetical protein